MLNTTEPQLAKIRVQDTEEYQKGLRIKLIERERGEKNLFVFICGGNHLLRLWHLMEGLWSESAASFRTPGKNKMFALWIDRPWKLSVFLVEHCKVHKGSQQHSNAIWVRTPGAGGEQWNNIPNQSKRSTPRDNDGYEKMAARGDIILSVEW